MCHNAHARKLHKNTIGYEVQNSKQLNQTTLPKFWVITVYGASQLIKKDINLTLTQTTRVHDVQSHTKQQVHSTHSVPD